MKQKTIAKLALFLTAALWGSTFSIGKIASEVFSASFIIALRFTVASLALLLAAIPKRKELDKKYWIDGFWMGITLFASYMLQVGGLALDTSPGKSAFLCLAGVGILSLSGGWGMSLGDIYTVLSGVPCAVNIVISAIVCRDRNVLLLTTIELWVVTIFAWMFVFLGKSFPTEFPLHTVGSIVYLGLFATALCLFMQSYGLKYAETAIGGMLLSLESVFGVIFSIIIYHETITLRMLFGFVVIFIAIVLAQWEGNETVPSVY